MEAQNVWGIAFPPDDWALRAAEETRRRAECSACGGARRPVGAETHASSLAGEEITIRLLQELQESADAHAREFQDRLKQLTHRLGLELEFDLRERAAHAESARGGRSGGGDQSSERKPARGKRGNWKARSQDSGTEMRSRSHPGKPARPPPLEEAQRQLTAMTNSVVESMNRAAEAGLSEYRSLLAKGKSGECSAAAPGRGRKPAAGRKPSVRILTPSRPAPWPLPGAGGRRREAAIAAPDESKEWVPDVIRYFQRG